MAPVSAEDIVAHRRWNLEVSQDVEKKLVGKMDFPPTLLLSDQEVLEFEAYRAKYYDQILNSEILGRYKALHAGLTQLMDYATDIVGKTGVFMMLCGFKHYRPNPTKEETDEAHFLTWSLFVLHGIYMPFDDLTDRTRMRRFKPAYHVQVGKELATIRLLLMFQAIEAGIAAKFCDKSYGNRLIRIWTRAFTVATTALAMDVQERQAEEKRWDFAYRDENTQFLCQCLHDLPMEMAALLTGYKRDPQDVEIWRQFNTALQNMMRNINDINDTYPSSPTGKPLYTDIANGASSWCSTKAFELANEEQRNTLKDNYGDEDPEKIAAVLQVYEDVGLKKHAEAVHQKSIKQVVELLKKCPETIVPQEVLKELFKHAADEHGLCWH